jgi:hypothetical protein
MELHETCPLEFDITPYLKLTEWIVKTIYD